MADLHPEYLRAYREEAMARLPAAWHEQIHEAAKARSGGRVSGRARLLAGNPFTDMAAISQSEDGFEITMPVIAATVSKDEQGNEHRIVYSVVYTPLLKDSHGDWAAPEDVESAAHGFLRDAVASGPTADVQHDGAVIPDIHVVESYVAPADLEIEGQRVLRGSWVIAHELGTSPTAENVWRDIKDGRLQSVSLQGSAIKEEVPCPA